MIKQTPNTWADVVGSGPVFDFLSRTYAFAPGEAVDYDLTHRRFLDSLPEAARKQWPRDAFVAALPAATPRGRVPGWANRFGIGNVSAVRPTPGAPSRPLLILDPMRKYHLIPADSPPRPKKSLPRETFNLAITLAGGHSPGLAAALGAGNEILVHQVAVSLGGAIRAAVDKVEKAGGRVAGIRLISPALSG